MRLKESVHNLSNIFGNSLRKSIDLSLEETELPVWFVVFLCIYTGSIELHIRLRVCLFAVLN